MTITTDSSRRHLSMSPKKMKLITEEFEELFKDSPLYSQEEVEDPVVVVKLFAPTGNTTWW
jgi:hypothetical protein